MAGKGSRRRPTRISKEVADANYETIFGKYVPPYLRRSTEEKEMQVRANPEGKIGTCGCGRSPTGDCIGWHGLNEEQLTEAKRKWDLDQYAKQAQETWNDSCTTPRKAD